MKKFFALITLIVLMIACRRAYFFCFQNDSEFNLYIIIDTCTQDNDITLGSYYRWIPANAEIGVESKNPWSERIKDSAYIYVVDADKISFPWGSGTLSREDKNLITPDVVLDSIVVYHSDFEKAYTVVYP